MGYAEIRLNPMSARKSLCVLIVASVASDICLCNVRDCTDWCSALISRFHLETQDWNKEILVLISKHKVERKKFLFSCRTHKKGILVLISKQNIERNSLCSAPLPLHTMEISRVKGLKRGESRVIGKLSM